MSMHSRAMGLALGALGVAVALAGPGAGTAHALTGPCVWNAAKQDWDYPPAGSGHSCANDSYSAGTQQGYVATRGAILENGKPVWAEYEPDQYTTVGGNKLFVPGVPKRIAVAEGDFEGAQVLTRDEVAFAVTRYLELSSVTRYGGKFDLIPAFQARSMTFKDKNGADLPPLRGLSPRTLWVMTLKQALTEPNTSPLLAEFPLDPRSVTDTSHTNYLVKTKADTDVGIVLHQTSGLVTDTSGGQQEGSIAYLSAFFSERPENQGRWGFCTDYNSGDYSNLKINGIPGRDDVRAFADCDAHRVGTIWAPFAGALVDSASRRMLGGPIPTGPNGGYDLTYLYLSNSLYWDTMYVTLNYQPLDPRSILGSRWYIRKVVPAGATMELDVGKVNAYQSSLTGSLGVSFATSAARARFNTEPDDPIMYGVSSDAFATDTHKPRSVNFPVEVAYMNGYIQYVNEQRSVPLHVNDPQIFVNNDDPLPKSLPPNYLHAPKSPPRSNVRLDANGEELEGSAGEAALQRVQVAKKDAIEAEDTPGGLLAPDGTPNPVFDTDLLDNIGRSDFANTDVYVFGPGGDLVSSRIGLRPGESPGLHCDPVTDPNVSPTCTVTEATPAAFVPIADFIRNRYPGARYKIVVINRSTGYMGTGFVRVGSDASDPTINGLASFKIEGDSRYPNAPILMRPPNLRVEVKRVPNGKRLGNDLCGSGECEQIVGFEGGGLSDDARIVITTEWLDWDGSPLPASLPGFTARLSRVAEDGKLTSIDPSGGKDQPSGANGADGSRGAGDISHFQIKPNLQTQVVRLSDPNAYHYYLHISGANSGRCGGASKNQSPTHESWEWFTEDSPACASFAREIDSQFDAKELSASRPARYVPMKVPVFDALRTAALLNLQITKVREEAAAAAAATAAGNPPPSPVSVKVPKVDPIYTYVYRAESQFSVYELPDFDAPELVTKYDPKSKTGKTSLSFGYDLGTTGQASELPTYGSNKDPTWSLGFQELLALVNENNAHAKFDDLEGLLSLSPAEQLNEVQGIVGQLTPDDYLALQLYLANDRGNPLFIDRDIAFPLVQVDVRPITLYKRETLARFPSDVEPPPPIQEGFEAVPFLVTRQAFLTIKATPRGKLSSDPAAVVLAAKAPVVPGKRYFVLDGEQLTELKVPKKFTLHFEAELPPGEGGDDPGQFKVHRTEIKVTREIVRDRSLGEIVEHNVNILDGTLRLSRPDFDLGGKGPSLALTRYYSNLGDDSDGLLGPGWSHSFDLRLTPTEIGDAGSGAVPPWVKDLRGRTSQCLPNQCPVEDRLFPNGGVQLTGVIVNGTSFRYDSASPTAPWKPERGRHVKLEQHCNPGDPETAPGGTPNQLRNCFEFTAKDGTRYFYDYPKTKAPVPPTLASSPTMVSLQDHLLERLYPANLRIPGVTIPDPGKPKEWRRSTLVRKMIDRFDYQLNIEPDEAGRVSIVTESETGRSCTFSYAPDPAAGCTDLPPSDKPRLHKVSCLGDQTDVAVTVSYCYDSAGYLASAKRGRRQEDYEYAPEPEKAPDPGSEEDEDEPDDAEKADRQTFNLSATVLLNSVSGPQRMGYAYRQGTGKFKPGVAPGAPDDGFDEFDMVERVTYPPTDVLEGSGDVAVAEIQFGYSDKIRTVSDPRGAGYPGTTYTLNGTGNPISIAEANGKVTTLAWSYDGASSSCGTSASEDNQMVSRTVTQGGGASIETSFVYDEDGNIVRQCVTSPQDGQLVTEQSWGRFGQLQSRTDYNNVTESWSLDPNDGFVNSHTDGAHVVTTFSRSNDYRGKPATAVTTGSGFTSTKVYGYDALGKLTSVVVDGAQRERSVFDARGRLVYLYDALQQPTHYTYDTNDNVTFVDLPPQPRDADQHVVTSLESRYDDIGNKTYEVNRNGLVLTHEYTSRNQVKRTTQVAVDATPSTRSRDFRYDAAGHVRSETDWKGSLTVYDYDQLGFLWHTTDRMQNVTTTERDLAGNVTRHVDAAGLAVNMTYDGLNRERTRKAECSEASQPECAQHKTDYPREPTPIGDVTGIAYTVDVLHGPDRTVVGYDGRGLRVAKLDARGKVYQASYDALGRLTQTIDEEHVTTTYRYDARGLLDLISVLGKSGSRPLTTTYVMDDAGRPLTETVTRNEGDLTTTTTYDAWGRVATRAAPGSNPELFYYDGEGAVVRKVDAAGRVRDWKRNQRGDVLDFIDAETAQRTEGQPPATSATSLHYERIDANGNPELIRDARGVLTEIQYDAEERVTTVIEAKGTADERQREMRDIDGMGNPHTLYDYGHRKIELDYTDFHHVQRVTDSLGRHKEYTYDRYGQAASEKNPRGFVRQFVRDSLGRVTDAYYPCSAAPCSANELEAHYDYDDVGHVVLERNRRGSETHYEYDDYSRLEFVKKGSGSGSLLTVAHFEHDDVGNVTAVTDAKGHRTEYRFNERNLLQHIVLPPEGGEPEAARTETRDYYPSGALKSVIAPTSPSEQARVVSYSYDREDRVVQVTAGGETTTYQYDLAGNRTRETRPEGQPGGKHAGRHRDFHYDNLSRLDLATDEVGLNTRYSYDRTGNLTDVEGPYWGDAPNSDTPHVGYRYSDEVDRLEKFIQFHRNGSLTTEYVEYDENDNVKQVRDASGRHFSYGYDHYDRRSSASYPNAPTAYYEPTSTTWDVDDVQNKVTITEVKRGGPTGTGITDVTVEQYDLVFDRLVSRTARERTVTFGYDDDGNRTRVASPAGVTDYEFDAHERLKTASFGGATTTYDYYADGRVKNIQRGNNTSTAFSYWPQTRRVREIAHQFAAGEAATIAYVYDRNGNPTAAADARDGQADLTTFDTYDASDRLVQFSQAGATTHYDFERHNRVGEKVTRNGVVDSEKTLRYDELDRLQSVTDHAGVVTSYGYDDNGNTISRVVSNAPSDARQFEYDALGQLVRVTRGPPNDRQVLGRYDYDSTGTRVRALDGERGDVEYVNDAGAVLEEHISSPGGGASRTTRYHYGEDLLAIAEATGTHFFHQDGQRTTTQLSDDAGLISTSYKHDPWGNVRLVEGDATDSRSTYTGQELDEKTGLYYYGARYYDANVGRFLSQDSYLGDIGDPVSLNRYLYAGANPARYSDPTGHFLLDDFENQMKAERAALNKEAGDLANSANLICGADGNVLCRGATHVVAGAAAVGAYGLVQFASATGEFAVKGLDYLMAVGATNVSLFYQNDITDQAQQSLGEETAIISGSLQALGQAATWGKLAHGIAHTATEIAHGNTAALADGGEALFTFGTSAAALGRSGLKAAKGIVNVVQKGAVALAPMVEATAEMVVAITKEPAMARAVVREATAIATAAVREQFALARAAAKTTTLGLRRMGAAAVRRTFVDAFAADIRQGLRTDLTGGIASTVKATGAGVKAVVKAAFQSEKAAESGLPSILRATGGKTIELGENWRAALEGLNQGDEIVYVLRDMGSGELLKVGKSTVAKAPGRFGPYARAGSRTGRNLGLDVTTFEHGSFTAEAIESEIRANMVKQGYKLPWDNTAGRLGRAGPGSPGASIPRALRSKSKWDYIVETLIPKDWHLGD